MKIVDKISFSKLSDPLRSKEQLRGMGPGYDRSLVSLQATDGFAWKSLIGPEAVFSATGPQVDSSGNPVAHNYIPNSEGLGGAPGVLPTGGWVKFDGSGITASVVGAGNGYTDWRIQGTASAGLSVTIRFTSGVYSPSALAGQTWTKSVALLLLSNVGTVPAIRIKHFERSSVDAFLGESTGVVVTTDGTEQQETSAVVNASTALLQPVILCAIANGTTVNFTIRISRPQLSKSAVKLPYVPTTGSAAFGPSITDKGLWAGGAWANLFTSVAPTAETKTLTAQKYCLQVFGTGASATCSYGTATEGSPLIFTATAGDTLFTPTTCAKWQLSASGGYVFPYCPPGITVPAASSTTGGNGTNTPLDARMLAALGTSAKFTACAAVYVGAGGGELPSATNHPVLSCSTNIESILFQSPTSIVKSWDGVNPPALPGTGNRDEIHLKVVQTNAAGTQFRVGNRRYTSTMVPIDSLTWGSWAAYDGSMNPLTHLRLALNGTIPLWFKLVSLSNKSLADADILRQLRYVK